MMPAHGLHGEAAVERPAPKRVPIATMESPDVKISSRTSDVASGYPILSDSFMPHDLGACSDWDLLTMNFDRGNLSSSGSLPDFTPHREISMNSLSSLTTGSLTTVPELWLPQALSQKVSSADGGGDGARRLLSKTLGSLESVMIANKRHTVSDPMPLSKSVSEPRPSLMVSYPTPLSKSISEPRREGKLEVREDCMPLWWKDMKEGTERKKQRALARSERRQRATAGSEARLLPQPRGMTMGELPTFRTKSGEEDGDRKVGDDYDLGKVCGKGTSSIIRHATHMESGLEVVVKSCRKIQMNSLAWGTLLEGVKVHETLQHPRILRIEDLYVSPTKVDMVLTYLEGGHLQAELDRRGRFSEEQASYIIHQLLEVLDFLHEREIVHRDITLRNVMLQKKGELAVKVIDFNLAVEWNGFEKLTDQCGSVPFASPERVQGTYTEKADMWSVGVITHMLLTGQPVYHGSEREVLFKASQGRIDLSEKLQECSQGAQQFVRSLLTINPVLRMSAEEALSHPWL